MRPKDSLGSSGAGVMGSCEMPMWVLETESLSSARVVHAFSQRAVSPVISKMTFLTCWKFSFSVP